MEPSITVLTQVCKELSLPFSFIDTGKFALEIQFPHHRHQVVCNTLGLISDADARIATDKSYQAQFLANTGIVPQTRQYVDPNHEFASRDLPNIGALSLDVLQNFSLPVVVKKNSGSQSTHVFVADTTEEIHNSFRKIFNSQSQYYDHVAVVQPYIEPVEEYRAIMLGGKLEFAYTKTPHTPELVKRWQSSRAQLIKDPQVLSEIQKLIDTLFHTWPITYAGLDIIVDTQGRYWLIEVNTSPGFRNFLRDNDPAPLKELYRKILLHLKEGKRI